MALSDIGNSNEFAVKRGLTWGTAVECGAKSGILLTGDTLKKDRPLNTIEELGQGFLTTSEPGEIKVDGDIPMLLRFDGADIFLANIMGSSTVYYQETTVLASGNSSSGSTTTLVDSGKTWTPDAFIGKFIVMRAGTGAYQVREITDNDATSVTFATATSPSTDTDYEICEYAPFDLGIATSATAVTLVDTAKTWSVDAFLTANKHVKITAGTGINQVRKITDNDATSITVATWTVTPDATSKYEISGATSRHIYDLTSDLDGKFLTFVRKSALGVFEVPSLKLTECDIKCGNNKPVELSVKGSGDDIVKDGVNDSSTFANVTKLETENVAMFKGESSRAVVRMNARDGSALAGGDALPINSLEFNFKRDSQGVYELTNLDKIDELSSVKNSCELKLAFLRTKAAEVAYWDDWALNASKKLDMVLQGDLIDNVRRSFTLQIPNAKISKIDSPVSKGIIPTNMELSVLAVNVAPAGMTGVTNPFRIILVNTWGGDPLQAGN